MFLNIFSSRHVLVLLIIYVNSCWWNAWIWDIMLNFFTLSISPLFLFFNLFRILTLNHLHCALKLILWEFSCSSSWTHITIYLFLIICSKRIKILSRHLIRNFSLKIGTLSLLSHAIIIWMLLSVVASQIHIWKLLIIEELVAIIWLWCIVSSSTFGLCHCFEWCFWSNRFIEDYCVSVLFFGILIRCVTYILYIIYSIPNTHCTTLWNYCILTF